MTLIVRIHRALFAARKSRETAKVSLLNTLYSEAMMVAKNKGNTEPSDSETIAVIQKFLKGVNETINILSKENSATDQKLAQLLQAQVEKQILEEFLPKMASEQEIADATQSFLATGGPTPKMGELMKLLKLQFGEKLDGKVASKVVTSILSQN